jgi:DNA mismatch endonuclease (patch repair protein)
MVSNRRRDTKPELAVRRILHAYGLRYRVDFRPDKSIRRSADIVFTKLRIAVFIDGCFWHCCPDHGRLPTKNREYWEAKLSGNRERDADTNARLTSAGWTVLRFWEHEDPATVAQAIETAVSARRSRS